ncbi:hypothetical protein ACFL0S_06075 [Thermodesulfobacteriota bacterium]
MVDKDTPSKELVALADEVYARLNLDGLSRRARLFILKFDGRPMHEVASDAGYTAPRKAVSRLMSNSQVKKNIDIISEVLEKSVIASKLDVLKFWSEVMYGLHPEFDPSHKLKASEYLGKVHRVLGPDTAHISGPQNQQINIVIADPSPVDADRDEVKRLEAEVAEQSKLDLGRAGVFIEAETHDEADMIEAGDDTTPEVPDDPFLV